MLRAQRRDERSRRFIAKKKWMRSLEKPKQKGAPVSAVVLTVMSILSFIKYGGLYLYT
jgi:hypothetical protein